MLLLLVLAVVALVRTQMVRNASIVLRANDDDVDIVVEIASGSDDAEAARLAARAGYESQNTKKMAPFSIRFF
jgi:hypothetical protein